ncbi:MAG: replicative helicase loader/inhibitor [Acutalibacteraceae bacterium]|nr:replicative helicase loader/inhibitor [Acutalibacteraceae bacterium]
MTREETIKILAMLNAFYAGGKNDPNQQVAAWYLIFQKYDYNAAKQAVINFAENDTRDYATFPACGVIVAEIRKVEAEMDKPIKEIIHRIQMGLDYYGLSVEGQKLILEPQYNEWLKVNAEEFIAHTKDYVEILRRRRDGADNGVIAVTSSVMKRLENGL